MFSQNYFDYCPNLIQNSNFFSGRVVKVMNLHEYQSKQLFARHGIPVPAGKPACSVAEAREVAQTLTGERWVVKAQVHAGGRGKVGGVVLVDSLDQVETEANRLLGSTLWPVA